MDRYPDYDRDDDRRRHGGRQYGLDRDYDTRDADERGRSGPEGYGSGFGPEGRDFRGGGGEDRGYGRGGGRSSGRGRGGGGRSGGGRFPQSYTDYYLLPGPMTGRGPEGYTRATDRIKDDVLERLTRHGEVDASQIRVEVEDGEVTLEGTVGSRREKRMAEDTAEGVYGVRDVHNRLRIAERPDEGGGDGPRGGGSEQSGGEGGGSRTGGARSKTSPSGGAGREGGGQEGNSP